jgi:hypothetical protein
VPTGDQPAALVKNGGGDRPLIGRSLLTIEQIQLSCAIFRKCIGFVPDEIKGGGPLYPMEEGKVYGAQLMCWSKG